VFKKNDERTIYNIIYRDGPSGAVFYKRCAITGLTRDKEYNLTKGTNGSRILYMSVNPNGEAETVNIKLKPRPRLKNLILDINFSEIDIKGKSSIGNIVTRYPVHKVELKEKGSSTLGGIKIWWDETVQRLNVEGKGIYLGDFGETDRILVLTRSGIIRLSGFELATHFEEDLLVIEKPQVQKIFTVVYYNGEHKSYYIKRFKSEATEKPARFYEEHPKSRFILISENDYPRFEIKFGGKHKKREPLVIDAADFIAEKSFKAKGKRLSSYEIASVTELEPLRFKEEVKSMPEPPLPDNTENKEEKPTITDGGVNGDQMTLF